MRMIHLSAQGGKWEAAIFTVDSVLAPEDFVGPADANRPDFTVDFDGEVEMPSQFLPADGDVYVKSSSF